MNRQKLVLGGLALLLGLSLAYAWWASPRQERVPAPTRPTSPLPQRVSSPAEPAADQRRVRLDILDREWEKFTDPERDIFSLSAGQPASVEEEPEEIVDVPPPSAFPREEVPRVEMPGSVAPKFTFLGFLEKNADKKVFLSLDNEVYIVRQGERFGPSQEFEVEEISGDKLVVRQGDVPVSVSMAVSVEQTPSLSGRTDHSPPAGGRSAGFGNFSPPVSPEETEPFDGEGEGTGEVDVVEEPPVEEPPPVGDPGASAEDQMSTLQLRSSIQ